MATLPGAAASRKEPEALQKIDTMLEKLQLKKQQSGAPEPALPAALPAKTLNWADDEQDESFELPEEWKTAPAPPERTTQALFPASTPKPKLAPPPTQPIELFPDAPPSQPPTNQHTPHRPRDAPRDKRKADSKEQAAFSRLAKGFLGGSPTKPPQPTPRNGSNKREQGQGQHTAKPPDSPTQVSRVQENPKSLLDRLEPRDVVFPTETPPDAVQGHAKQPSQDKPGHAKQPSQDKSAHPRRNSRAARGLLQTALKDQKLVQPAEPKSKPQPTVQLPTPVPPTAPERPKSVGTAASRWAH